MKTSLFAAGAAVALLAAGSAGAATSIEFSGYGVALNPGEVLVTDFSSPVSTLAGYVLSGTGSFLTGTSGDGAAPAFDAVNRDPAQYLSIEAGQTENLSTPLLSSISFYIGSLDSYNWITFTEQGGATEVFNGTDLAAAVSAAANGNQQSSNTNGRYTFDFSTPITNVSLYSGGNSFEIADIGAGAVPEPATWATMLLGFGAMGVAMRWNRRVRALA
jgi:hypothetical protein